MKIFLLILTFSLGFNAYANELSGDCSTDLLNKKLQELESQIEDNELILKAINNPDVNLILSSSVIKLYGSYDGKYKLHSINYDDIVDENEKRQYSLNFISVKNKEFCSTQINVAPEGYTTHSNVSTCKAIVVDECSTINESQRLSKDTEVYFNDLLSRANSVSK